MAARPHLYQTSVEVLIAHQIQVRFSYSSMQPITCYTLHAL